MRDYVDQLASYLDASDNVYKGERDGEDLSYLSEDQIWERLKVRFMIVLLQLSSFHPI